MFRLECEGGAQIHPGKQPLGISVRVFLDWVLIQVDAAAADNDDADADDAPPGTAERPFLPEVVFLDILSQ